MTAIIAVTPFAAQLDSAIALADADTPAEIMEEYEAARCDIFPEHPGWTEYFDEPSVLLRKRSDFDHVKKMGLVDARSYLDRKASMFAENVNGGRKTYYAFLRANGFQSVEHFTGLVTQGRTHGVISIDPSVAMIRSLKTMFGEDDFAKLIDAVTTPTAEEKREALITTLRSHQMMGFYLVMVQFMMMGGIAAAVTSKRGFVDTGSLAICGVALVSSFFTARSVRTAVGDLRAGLSCAGNPDKLQAFLKAPVLREFTD